MPVLPCRLEKLGSPEAVAKSLFEKQLAPPGSGITPELVRAASRRDSQGRLYYVLEYRVAKGDIDNPKWRRRNLSVLCANNGLLYTFNAQASADRWDQYAAAFQQAAGSFMVK